MTNTTILDSKTFGYWAHLAIQKHFQKTFKHETDVIQDTDPEALHQMRVGMRRLRTAVTGFAPALDLPKAAQEKEIAKVAQKLGDLRDLDVLHEALVDKYLPVLPIQEQDTLKKALITLGKQRHKSLERVKTTLDQQRYQELKSSLEAYVEQPTYSELAEIAIADILPDLLLPSVSKLFLHPGWLIGVKLAAGQIEVPSALNSEIVLHLLETHHDTLHSLRKQAKRVRYQMELFTDFYEANYQNHLQQVKAIQSILGHIQDSFVLAKFLKHTLNLEITEQLPTLTALWNETRYQVWQEWRPIQQQYLNPQTKKDFYQAVLQPTSPSDYQCAEDANK
ncbi:CHAD domain-containing protein [Lyngbya aestuarii]|uniref:CHAD domain-containing protein n=1 Tax=Lyngbya aestuarii TaxID=118322 RepID=UPI00403D96AD